MVNRLYFNRPALVHVLQTQYRIAIHNAIRTSSM